ncbi:hypothetical protein BAUCODRAFT_387629 [Baudoinia panamericana UAMH 10762]|uniref:RFX-type winged-helix domain-containing protein n=1 Tax=Baudoinia panamericana (strain UAMH 10762) TaxID=717646 RepID=M2NI39_BAUPA|nr:uncharacterized protein BAUCODRAFT_387629 [Baudoinia panamericana UAMH 10762]EMC99009.1 hypothetical protein BAUCODRAFT_387629 [Baudoinia panamericana UAMH 10762]
MGNTSSTAMSTSSSSASSMQPPRSKGMTVTVNPNISPEHYLQAKIEDHDEEGEYPSTPDDKKEGLAAPVDISQCAVKGQAANDVEAWMSQLENHGVVKPVLSAARHTPSPLNIQPGKNLVAHPPRSPTRYISKEAPHRHTASHDDLHNSISESVAYNGASGTVEPWVPPSKLDDILHYDIRARAVFWMNRALTADKFTMVFQSDLYTVYSTSFAKHMSSVMAKSELLDLVVKMFKGAIAHSEGADNDAPVIRNIAWRGQPTCEDHIKARVECERQGSVQRHPLDAAQMTPNEMQGFIAALDDDYRPSNKLITKALLRKGRRLFHVAEPVRTRLWLRMLFETGHNEKVLESSVWEIYKQTFGPYCVDHPYLDATNFLKAISRVFPQSEDVEVAPEERVIWGIRPREVLGRVSDVLKRYHQHQVARRYDELSGVMLEAVKNGEFVIPDPLKKGAASNKFQQALLLDPLFPLPASQESPWMLRLRRRANGEPLGDQQTGFPEVSMKQLSRKIARDLKYAARTLVNSASGRDLDGACMTGSVRAPLRSSAGATHSEGQKKVLDGHGSSPASSAGVSVTEATEASQRLQEARKTVTEAVKTVKEVGNVG